MNPVEITRGSSPLVLGMPHTGTHVPERILDQLNPNGRLLADTDWHIHQLYRGLVPDVTTVRATFHRYVIDANRDPDGHSLYPGQNTTGLVPISDFDGNPIWLQEPTEQEITDRREAFHKPYHSALQQELDRVRGLHGTVVLFDCHSIRSRIPFLFDGQLPDFNIGNQDGVTCAPVLADAVQNCAEAAAGYSSVLNGRFKGGWTTRHYGRPERGCHAIQLELAQSTYLTSETAPFDYDPKRAETVRRHLTNMLQALARLCPSLS